MIVSSLPIGDVGRGKKVTAPKSFRPFAARTVAIHFPVRTACLRSLTIVPTVFRFLIVILVLGGIGYAAMAALAFLVHPDIREIVVSIPADRLPAYTR